MDRERILGTVRRVLRTPLVAWRRAPKLRAESVEWRRFRVDLLRYTLSGVNFGSPAAHRYCVGRGLEIGGAAPNPFDLDSRNVDLTDSLETVFKRHEIALCGRALRVDIVAPGDELPVPDESQGFVVSSHVLEHFTNPVKALLEWNRVVRPGGTIFMIVPHKDRTFEASLPRTPLEHMIRDYEEHCGEPEGDPMGHNHVWVTEDIVELVLWMKQRFSLPWEILEVQDVDDKVGNGFTIVIRKFAP